MLLIHVLFFLDKVIQKFKNGYSTMFMSKVILIRVQMIILIKIPQEANVYHCSAYNLTLNMLQNK